MMNHEADDEMVSLVGRAVIEWSKVEMYWAHIFRDLLFYDLGESREKDAETGNFAPPADFVIKDERADAVYFAAGSSHAQRRLIRNVGGVVLEARSLVLAKLKELLATTSQLADSRNALVHAFYDNPIVVTDTGWQLQPLAIQEMTKFKKRPAVAIPEASKAFKKHADEVAELWVLISNPEAVSEVL